MGGNALKPAKTKRLDKQSFVLATNKVVSVLSRAIQKVNAEHNGVVKFQPYEVKAYRHKETFGDLDLLVDKELFKYYKVEQMFEDVKVEFNFDGELPKHRNGPVLSFGVPSDEKDVYFQVDLIHTSAEDFLTHASYLNWNDLGNLVGVVASKTKILKHGHDGLYYVVRDGYHQLGEVRLTNDYLLALEFLGYDPRVYEQGLDTLQDVYVYAASSKFFDPKLYSFEERNHDQRMRDRKRPTYNGFLQYIEEQDVQGAFNDRVKLQTEDWVKRVYEYFPSFNEKYEEMWDSYNKKKEVRSYFNGDLVLKYKPELNGPELGKYMGQLKSLVKDFDEFVLTNKERTVEMLIVELEKNPS